MTSYEAEVGRLQAVVLGALRQHTEPDRVSQQLVREAFPGPAAAAAAALDDEPAGALTLPPLADADKERLTNALHAAAGQLLADAKSAGQEVMQYSLEGHEQAAAAELVDSVFWLADQNTAPVDAGLAAQLLEQLFEGASTAGCEGIFAYLDSRTATFKVPAVFGRSKITLLRTCNMLLNRLSKSANAMLCGRILLFLAKFMALTDRSAVNLNAQFNSQNVTPVEEVPEDAVDSEGKPVDAAFYRTFWGLQAYFSNPLTALQGGKWSEVSRDVRRVLDKFKQEKVTVGESRPAGTGASGDGHGVSVKYLSSSRLMGLQLRDASFRRHFLLQCLILMQWCEKPRHKERKEGLRGKLLEDLQELRVKVYGELEATPDKGREFAAAIRHLMQWEDSWVAWKQGSCPPAPLERRPAEPPAAGSADLTAPAPKRRKLGSDAIFGVRVGTAELDRLWNLTEDNLSALSADDRGGFKTVRQLMEPVIEGMREAAAGEDDGLLMKASRSKLYSWKALRAVARTNLQAFAQAVQKGSDLEVAARQMYPADCPPPPAPPPAAAAQVGVAAAAAGGSGGMGQLAASNGAAADAAAGDGGKAGVTAAPGAVQAAGVAAADGDDEDDDGMIAEAEAEAAAHEAAAVAAAAAEEAEEERAAAEAAAAAAPGGSTAAAAAAAGQAEDAAAEEGELPEADAAGAAAAAAAAGTAATVDGEAAAAGVAAGADTAAAEGGQQQQQDEKAREEGEAAVAEGEEGEDDGVQAAAELAGESPKEAEVEAAGEAAEAMDTDAGPLE